MDISWHVSSIYLSFTQYNVFSITRYWSPSHGNVTTAYVVGQKLLPKVKLFSSFVFKISIRILLGVVKGQYRWVDQNWPVKQYNNH
jgi:hypothetical protein